jgi:glutathione reductase (NADPH)
MSRFDVVVLGSGSAGAAVARRCAGSGRSVAVIENRPPGGTCAQRGCIPKKVLTDAAATVQAARRLRGRGVRGYVALDWPALSAWRATFTDPVPESTRSGFDGAGITLIEETAEFTGADTLRAGDRDVGFDGAVVATGAVPAPLSMEGSEHLIASDEFFLLEKLPERIAFVGGGYISFEFAHVAASAGSHPVILHRNESPLRAFDPDLVHQLCESSSERGIEVRLNHRVEAVHRLRNGSFRVDVAGKPPVEADLVVHGAGRVPAVAGLGLERAGVKMEKRRIVLNDHLQSPGNERIFAAGDASGTGPALTPAASLQAEIVAANLLRPASRRWIDRSIPSVVFTDPPLAAVGVSSRNLPEGIDVVKNDTGGWFTARHRGETHGAAKILIESSSRKIVGAHLLGPGSSEVINLFALAMEAKMTVESLRAVPFVFPTAGSDTPAML